MATYTVPSGDRIWAGRDVVMPDPSNATFTWPPAMTLTIPSVAGVDAPIHPKVLDLGAAWNGYRYWMAFTPYPVGNDDTKENPSIVASNDRSTWVAPTINPIIPAPSGAATGIFYNSDTHLLYKDGVMYLIYRTAQHASYYGYPCTEIVYEVHSSDGVLWSSPVQIHQQTATTKAIVLSPSIEYFNGVFRMWVVRADSDPLKIRVFTSSSITGPWAQVGDTTASISDGDSEIWHVDMCRVPNGWALLVSTRYGTTQDLWFGFSKDGVNFGSLRKCNSGSPNTYRSSIVMNATGFDFYVSDYDSRKIKILPVSIEV